MRRLTADEIERARDPRVQKYEPPANSRSVPPVPGVARSVRLDGEYVLVDRASYEIVCARLGIPPEDG